MIIAIDTGGTKTFVAGISGQGEIICRHRIATPKNPAEYIEKIEYIIKNEFIKELSKGQIKAVSIAVPASIDNDTVLWAQNLGWKNFKIIEELSKLFPNLKFILDNDANLAGLYEARNEPANKTILYITVSTGIGSGIIYNNKISKATKNSEPGRIIVSYDNKMQEWEKFASGKAIARIYNKLADEITDKRIWYDIADKISRGLLVITPLIQPEKIIIGGSIGCQFDKFSKPLNQLLEEKLPNNIGLPILAQASEPENAVLLGCYENAKNELFR